MKELIPIIVVFVGLPLGTFSVGCLLGTAVPLDKYVAAYCILIVVCILAGGLVGSYLHKG